MTSEQPVAIAEADDGEDAEMTFAQELAPYQGQQFAEGGGGGAGEPDGVPGRGAVLALQCATALQTQQLVFQSTAVLHFSMAWPSGVRNRLTHRGRHAMPRRADVHRR